MPFYMVLVPALSRYCARLSNFTNSLTMAPPPAPPTNRPKAPVVNPYLKRKPQQQLQKTSAATIGSTRPLSNSTNHKANAAAAAAASNSRSTNVPLPKGNNHVPQEMTKQKTSMTGVSSAALADEAATKISKTVNTGSIGCLLYTSPSPRD
mgnify:CR=1 FL=1